MMAIVPENNRNSQHSYGLSGPTNEYTNNEQDLIHLQIQRLNP